MFFKTLKLPLNFLVFEKILINFIAKKFVKTFSGGGGAYNRIKFDKILILG
jgi:hypothetical protein